MSAHAIQLAIREAAAHERTAGKAEDAYAAKMKAAGASMFNAFKLACGDAPELQGRKLDDKAMTRLYASTSARPWWDKHLTAAKFVTGKGVANRDDARRLIQWHLDPGAAAARAMTRKVQQLAAQKKLAGQRVAATRGMNSSPKPRVVGHDTLEDDGGDLTGRIDRHAARITDATTTAMLAGRELPVTDAPLGVTQDDLLGERNRVNSAVSKITAEQRPAAFEILRVTARELEELAG